VSGAAQVLALFPPERLRLTADGRIIDFLDSAMSRQNTPEERVRQDYARNLHHDYGYPKEIMVFGAPVTIGSETKFADIVIYNNVSAARRKDQAQIRIVVETKAPEIKRGVAQLTSYIFASSAQGGVWINQTDAPKYFHRQGRDLKDWPNIPRVNEEWDAIGRRTKENLSPPHNLVETFRRCHNALYKVGIDSEDLAMDMVRMILAKYRDEQDEGETCEFRCTPSELHTAEGRRRVADRVTKLFNRVRDDNRDVFDRHETITAGHREIATVVSELQDFRFVPDEDSDEVYDVVGAAYEVYVGSHLKGDRGQYFTHRLIVQLLVRLVDPGEDDIIADPAMGSGGFLIAAMRHVTQKIMRSARTKRSKRTAIDHLHRHIFGIDKSPKLVKVARTNMILASDGHSGLVHGDSLEPLDRLREDFVVRAGPGVATIILTNPPFGATVEHRITADKEHEILEQFDLGKVWRKIDGQLEPTDMLSGEGVPPEYLFVERCIRWVRPGGKVGIVVPRGLLDNDKALPVRTLILRDTRVLAIVNCHDDTFKPYTDAKAALLVLEKKKGAQQREDDYQIFMAISQGIGHNGVGEPIFRTNATGDIIVVNGEPVLDHDCDDIYAAWRLISDGQASPSGNYYALKRRDIHPESLILNPVRYLPRYSDSRRRVLALGEQDGWKVEHLGQIADVFNGPRFKRPYADRGVTRGSNIVRYFTGNAVTQTKGENLKYLDLAKAKPVQIKMINKLYLSRGMILITDSGTVGRVIYTTQYHEGAVGTNNLIRVVIPDEALRGYVYQFLSSRLGQDQLRANIYGAIVDHLEPSDVKNVVVPIPTDDQLIADIGLPVIRSIELQEHAYAESEMSRLLLAEELGDFTDEDARDAEIARNRLAEIVANPTSVLRGDALEEKLEQWQSE
jgi:type I restriction enzyme M protein